MSGVFPTDNKPDPNQKKLLKCKLGFHTIPKGRVICKFCGAYCEHGRDVGYYFGCDEG